MKIQAISFLNSKKNGFKKILILILFIFISLFFLEFFLRYVGFKKFTLYYTSNFYGYYHVPNQDFLSRFNKSISLDTIGNRNPKDNNIKNSEIFFLGDSVTYGGSIVNNEEIFANLISNKLKKKYLNISANGWGIPNIINFVEFHNLYKNNSLYLFTCINDCFTRNLRKSEQNFFFKRESNFAIINFLKLAVFKLNERNYGPWSYENKNDILYNYKTIEYSINKLKKFNDKLKSFNSKLIFIYSPNSNYLKSVLSSQNYERNNFREEIFKQLNKADIEIINIIEHFDEKTLNNFGKFYVDHVHLSKDGHKLYSEILPNLIND